MPCITTKDLLEELGEDFRKSLNELSFEKAEKGFKKMRDVKWRRVSIISDLICHRLREKP